MGSRAGAVGGFWAVAVGLAVTFCKNAIILDISEEYWRDIATVRKEHERKASSNRAVGGAILRHAFLGTEDLQKNRELWSNHKNFLQRRSEIARFASF